MTGRAWQCEVPWTRTTITCAAMVTAFAFALPRAGEWLVADARIAHGQLWRAVTGPLLHATWGHLIRDLALIAIAGIAYESRLVGGRAVLFIGGITLPAVAVLIAGDADWYCGTSGLSHALIGAALTYELGVRRGAARIVVGALCIAAAAKPFYELASGAPMFPMSLGDGVTQVPLAHAVGALVGVACAMSRRTATRRRGAAVAQRQGHAAVPKTLDHRSE